MNVLAWFWKKFNYLALIPTIITPVLCMFHFLKPRGFFVFQMEKSSRKVELQISLITKVKKHNRVATSQKHAKFRLHYMQSTFKVTKAQNYQKIYVFLTLITPTTNLMPSFYNQSFLRGKHNIFFILNFSYDTVRVLWDVV